MTTEEIHQVLHAAAEVTMPRFTEDDTPGRRAELLEDYLNLTAVAGAELNRARLQAHSALRLLENEWDDIKGYGMSLPSSRKATAADVTDAKREIRPDLYNGIREAKWLVARLSEQLDRLSKMGDDQVASRIYSLIAG